MWNLMTFNLGLTVITKYFDKVAKAIIEYCSKFVTLWLLVELSSMISGSMAHTSPFAPENKHFETHPRFPNFRVKFKDQTEPPESEHRANAGLSVHFKLRTPEFGVTQSKRLRRAVPDFVSNITMSPLANPANSLLPQF